MHGGAVDPREGSDKPQEAKQPQDPRSANGWSERDEIDPVAAQVPATVVGCNDS
jgi:hypothetical protein